MTIKELFEVALTVMGSLGGGGAIVFAFSHLLGRLWADRALEEHRHKFNQLNQQMQHDLDLVTRRVQVELDALTLVHNLRTTEEFNRVATLWKKFANLSSAFSAISGPRKFMGPSYQADWRKYHNKLYSIFEATAHDAQEFYDEEMVFIPEVIAEQAGHTLGFASTIVDFLQNRDDVPLNMDFSNGVELCLRKFEASFADLYRLIRKYVRGEPLGEIPDRHPPDDEGGVPPS